ncbi:MAG: SLBB domain-containing protein [Scytonematopsis contorta HA4267-MV1]|nr:SLBB domain-containing protein [Scytonematopsis contorta HA4267-MV1]
MHNTGLLKTLNQPLVGVMLLSAFIVSFPNVSSAQQRRPQRPNPGTPSRPFQTQPFQQNSTTRPLSSGQLDTNYTLGGGDRIKVNVFEVPEYTGDYQIPPGGGINLPLIGSVNVLGLTTEQAADLIAQRYARFLKRPIISVNLLSPRPINIIVAGEVTRPGSYAVGLQGGAGNDPGVQFPTVISAITTAQGYLPTGDISRVELRRKGGRGGEQVVSLDLRELVRTGRIPQDITLRDGDTIFVPRVTNFDIAEQRNLASTSFAADPTRPRTVAVIGEVTRPGSYLVTSGATEQQGNNPTGAPSITGQPTVMRAIQLAGGITPQADLRNVTLRRPSRTAEKQEITINFWELLQSGNVDLDLIVQEGDTIVIPTASEVTAAEAVQLATTTFSPSRMLVGVVGEVKKPGQVELQPNSSLNQALLAAGGFNDARARSSEVELIRLNPNGTVTKRKVKVDLAAGINEANNPILRNNDIVQVGRSGIAQVSDPINVIAGPFGTILNVIRFIFGGF